MTNKQYFVEHDTNIDDILIMFKKSGFKSLETFLSSTRKWNPLFKVGDIFSDSDGACIVTGIDIKNEMMVGIEVDDIVKVKTKTDYNYYKIGFANGDVDSDFTFIGRAVPELMKKIKSL